MIRCVLVVDELSEGQLGLRSGVLSTSTYARKCPDIQNILHPPWVPLQLRTLLSSPGTANLPEMVVCFMLPSPLHSPLSSAPQWFPPPMEGSVPRLWAKLIHPDLRTAPDSTAPPSPSGNCLPGARGHHPLLAFLTTLSRLPASPLCLALKCWHP